MTEPWQICIGWILIYLLIGLEFFIVIDRNSWNSYISWTERLDEVAIIIFGWPICAFCIACLVFNEFKDG